MDKKEFVIGQVWRRRDGEIVTIIDVDIDAGATYPIKGSDYSDRKSDGFWLSATTESDRDLVELVQDVDTLTPTPNPEAIADAALEQAAVTVTAEQEFAEHGGVMGLTPCSSDRSGDYAQIIMRGMMEGMSVSRIRDFIDLYDSAVDGTS